MFFKKKRKQSYNFYDRQHMELWKRINASKLARVAQHVLVTKLAIELYPEGADKEFAKEEHAAGQQLLLAMVGDYDGALSSIVAFRKEHEEKLQETKGCFVANLLTSHQVVEAAIKDFYSR